MPITLPPLSRRRWLQGALASGVGGLLANSREGELWALMSDTHIAADARLQARGAVMADQFSRCINQVLGLGQKPFGLLINGDCAYLDGQASDYETFIRCLEPLRDAAVAVHCTLGNHDNRRNFIGAMTSPQDARPLESRHVSLLSSATMNWVLLDSLETVNATPGKVGPEQLGWLERTLQSCPNRPTVVMAHHNPPGPDSSGKKHSGLTDSEALLGVLGQHSKVKAFIFGHTHQWSMRRVGQLSLINLPPTAYTFSPQAPSGWVKVIANAKGMTLELRCLNPAHENHGQTFEVPWG